MVGTRTKCDMEMVLAADETEITCGAYAVEECHDCHRPVCEQHVVMCETCGQQFCYVFCIEDHECHPAGVDPLRLKQAA